MKMGIFVWSAWMFSIVSFVAGGETGNALPRLVPMPQHLEWAAKTPEWLPLKDLSALTCPAECTAAAGAGLEQLNRRLQELGFACLAIDNSAEKGVVRLSLSQNPGTGSSSITAQAYSLRVLPENVDISASSPVGLYYGLITLSQLIDKEGRIPRVDITDQPSLGIRGTYIAGYDDWEERILYWASLKLNLALFESAEFYKLSDPVIRKRWEDIFALCRKHFIEPIPELQSLGWGNQVLELLPEAAEGVSVENLALQVSQGRVAAPEGPSAPDAMPSNAGFEAGEGNHLAGWSQDSPETFAFIDAESPYEGQGCLRITTEPRAMFRVWQDVDCAPDSVYELSGFIKNKDVVQGLPYIEIYGLAGPDRLGEWLGKGDSVGPDAAQWRRTAVRFETKSYTRLRVFARIQGGSGTVYFDAIAVKGLRKPNPLSNVIVTERSPVVVKDATGSITYVQDTDYRLNLPALRFPYESEESLSLSLLPGSKMKEGDTVLLSCTYAPLGSVSCCASEPRYQEFMRESLRTTIALLHPKYVCIGHDEPRAINRDRRCTERGLTSAQLFADDIERMREYVRAADPAVRIIMFGDALSPYHKTESYARLTDAAELIPRDVIIALWWYDDKDSEQCIDKAVPYFLNLGFDITGSPWFTRTVAYRWAKVLSEYAPSNAHVLGEIYTSWAAPNGDPWQALETTAQYSWNITQPPTPEIALTIPLAKP